MKKLLLWSIIVQLCMLRIVAQETFTINYNGGEQNLTASSATVNDEITLVFTDVDAVNNFYTDGQEAIYIYAGVETDAGTWQHTFSTFCVTDNAKRTVTKEGNSYKTTFKISELLELNSGLNVKSFQFKYYNQYCGGGNNETANLSVDLVDAEVESDNTIIGNVKVTPAKPTRDELITIELDVTGTPLENASTVYFHSGVGTDEIGSTAFTVSKGNWGQDDGVGKMTNTSGTIWKITLNSINDYYNLQNSEDAFGLNFLFRNTEGSLKEDRNGGNYHVDLDPGNYFLLNDDLASNSPFLVEKDKPYTVTTEASGTANWTVYETNEDYTNNKSTIASGTGQNIRQNITLTDVDIVHYYKIVYDFGSEQKVKTFSLQGYSSVVFEALPDNMEYGVNYNTADKTKATIVFHTPINTTYYGFNKDTNVRYELGKGTTQTKKTVHLLGDFNNWKISSQSMMKCGKKTNTGDCEVWWQELTELEEGKEYVYQFLVDGNLNIADPYATKVSDPWNDQYINETIYPSLISNPNTNHIAAVLQTNKSDYNWQVPNFEFIHNNRHDRLNIYELHFRDFTAEGTYKAATAKLDYLKEMGINTIHVMPVSEFEGNDSWGYNPSFYFAADKAYGTENDLKEFIDEAHKRGIAVINDMVLNHAFGQNSMARLYWDELKNKPTADNPWFFADHWAVSTPDGYWGSDFNHTSEHTQKLVDDILVYWMNEFKFDGFRFDFTKGFSHMEKIGGDGDVWASSYNANRIGLLERMVTNMRTNVAPKNPIVVFEHLAQSNENAELATLGILQWSGSTHHKQIENFSKGYSSDNIDLYSSGIYTAQGFNNANWMSYMESHDEERQGYAILEYANNIPSTEPDKTSFAVDRLKLASAFNLFFPGPRMIWMWEEMGYDISINYNGRTGRKPQHWEYLKDTNRAELHRLMSFILNLRDTYDLYAITPDYGNIGDSGNINSPRKMILNDGNGKIVIVIGNPDTENGQNVAPGYYYTGTWYKYNGDTAVDGSSFTVNNKTDTYYLQPNEVMILTNFQETTNNTFQLAEDGTGCRWSKGLPKSGNTDTLIVACDTVFDQDFDGPQSSLEIKSGVEFKLDKGRFFRTGDVKVSGSLFLDDGSEFRQETINP
ncbi:4-alpha-D-((1-_4)-alpha-D-glucano)trehalose trehalohydrolase [Flavobacteriaceae bacterium UJ101]|nr:4-alpha-D-((1->4)-alpha-D-glucano)trehalose trehalohydrolase [Flavobacteriaceae bacterium UJ101]